VVSITIRHPKFSLSKDTPRYWYGDDPARTHFMNALSSTFPEGEAFFVRSVQHFKDRVAADEAFLRDIKRFSGQEGVHSRVHDAHVDLLVEQGYPAIRKINHQAGREMRFWNRHAPVFALASTAALEHLTAIMANQALEDPDYWGGQMHPDMAPVWMWHAMEEAEHKAVAYDLLQVVSDSYALRCFALVLAAVGLLADNIIRFAYFNAKDGNFWKPRIWLDGIRFVWGRDGMYRRLIPDFMRWFRRDFHPWQQDNQHLIEDQLARMTS
jgi:predicted metal-dependent hydrolase